MGGSIRPSSSGPSFPLNTVATNLGRGWNAVDGLLIYYKPWHSNIHLHTSFCLQYNSPVTFVYNPSSIIRNEVQEDEDLQLSMAVALLFFPFLLRYFLLPQLM
ncbi:hypothetical protein Hanom_Chr16g01475251 [Helianthus anomalus]